MLFSGALPPAPLFCYFLDAAPLLRASGASGLGQSGAAQSLAFAPLGVVLGLGAVALAFQCSLRRLPANGWGFLLGLGFIGVATHGPAVPVPELWGAPLHVLAALASFAAAAAGGLTRGGRLFGPLAAGLLLLGLVWNYVQNAAQLAWAWDWIEAVPGYLVFGSLLSAHLWARFRGVGPTLLFLGGLQFGRMALSQSLHHTAPTLGLRGAETAAFGFIATGFGWAGALAGLSFTPTPRPPLPSPTPARPWGSPPYLVHAAAAAALFTLAFVAWLGSVWGGSSPAPSWGPCLVVLGGSLARRPPLRPLMTPLLRGLSLAGSWVRGGFSAAVGLGLLWGAARINRHSLINMLRYASQILVPAFRPTSVFGFGLLLGIYAQMLSGFLLALYYLPDPTYTAIIREDLCFEVWWFLYVYLAHVIGVDTLFVLSYLHILKKVYLRNYADGDLEGWFTGAYAFLIFHVVVFLGITLSTNHLGDVTIMIAANIYWSLFFRWHKVYAPFFTNKHLSVDQLTRFMVAHYLSAWYYTYLVQTHVLFVHEMWDADSNRSTQQTSNTPKGAWIWDALKKEGLAMLTVYLALSIGFFFMGRPSAHVVDYSFFEQWSETEVEEINFFIVAPHWYFRAHMGLLTVCAHHYEGLAWLVGFYLLLCYTPHLYRAWTSLGGALLRQPEAAPVRQSLLQDALFFALICSITYVGGTLPCGRFYYENVDGFFGNSFLRLSYEYVYLYLGFLAHVADRVERLYCAGGAARRFLLQAERLGVQTRRKAHLGWVAHRVPGAEALPARLSAAAVDGLTSSLTALSGFASRLAVLTTSPKIATLSQKTTEVLGAALLTLRGLRAPLPSAAFATPSQPSTLATQRWALFLLFLAALGGLVVLLGFPTTSWVY